jgi:ribonuclease HIII
MIECIIEDSKNVEQELYNSLYTNIQQLYPQSTITLKNNEIYWKYPEYRNIIYGITLIPCIKVKELISHHPIT